MKYRCLWKFAVLLTSQAFLTPVHAASTKAPAGASYSVKSGDTFAKIARAKGIGLGELLKANRISNPDRITQGQKIVIPGSKTAKPAAAEKTAAKAPSPKASANKPSPGKTVAKNTPSSKKQTPVAVEARHRDSTTVNVAPPAPKGSYIVQSGDTLNRVQRLTGTPVSDLLKLNKLAASSTLRPGQKLRLSTVSPGKAVVSAYPKAPRPAAAKSVGDERETVASTRGGDRPVPVKDIPVRSIPAGTAPHKVEKGETFTSIQRTYGLTNAQLAKANPDINPGRLQPGQTVMIPGLAGGVEARPLPVRADGRVIARHQDPLATAGGSAEGGEDASSERTRTGYLVEDGEDIQKIARRFHTSDREIRRLNRMGESDDVYPGRYILVPFNRQAPSEGAGFSRRDA